MNAASFAAPAAQVSSSSPFLLKPHELSYYDRLFSEVDSSHTGFVTGQQIKLLFTTSKLTKSLLAEVWKLADRQKRKMLDREDFHCALRLIAMAQQGIPLNLSQGGMDLQLPVFEGVLLPQPISTVNQQTPVSVVMPVQRSAVPSPSLPPVSSPSSLSDWSMTDTEKVQ
jgi:hypothetical protein